MGSKKKENFKNEKCRGHGLLQKHLDKDRLK